MKFGFYKINIGFDTIAEHSFIGWYRIGSEVRLHEDEFIILEFLFDPF